MQLGHQFDRTLAQALARLAAWFDDPTKRLPAAEPIIDDDAVIFGQRYPTGALIAEADGGDAFEDPRRPTGRPGGRAPHLVVERAGARQGIHDLFGKTFTLLTGPDGDAWCSASARVAGRLDIGLPAVRVGADVADVAGRFTAAYGVGARGAVLVRPDGVIAWRCRDAAPEPDALLAGALGRILGRPRS